MPKFITLKRLQGKVFSVESVNDFWLNVLHRLYDTRIDVTNPNAFKDHPEYAYRVVDMWNKEHHISYRYLVLDENHQIGIPQFRDKIFKDTSGKEWVLETLNEDGFWFKSGDKFFCIPLEQSIISENSICGNNHTMYVFKLKLSKFKL